MQMDEALLTAWLKVSVNLRNHRLVYHLPYNQAFCMPFYLPSGTK